MSETLGFQFSDSVFRVAKVCDLLSLEENHTRKRLLLDKSKSQEMTKEIIKEKDFFFNTIQEDLPEGTTIKFIPLDKIKDDFKEGPIVIFPAFELKTVDATYTGRFCATVCMGENRTKLWIRLSSPKTLQKPEDVNNFYKQAKELVTLISGSIFNCYKQIMERSISNAALKDTYSITVMGTELLDNEPGNLLKIVCRDSISLTKAFTDYSDLFNISKSVIFPNSHACINSLEDYKQAFLGDYEWISVESGLEEDASIFLKSKNKESHETKFVGIGYSIASLQKATPRLNVPFQPVMQRSSRAILSTISPNI